VNRSCMPISRTAPFAATLLAILVGNQTFAQANIRSFPNRDTFTDANRSTVQVYADQQSRFARDNVIVWRCNGNDAYELFIANDEFLTTNGPIPAIFRFDAEPATSNRWNASTNGTAAFAPNADARAQFTRNALAATRVSVGLTNYRGTRYEYTFPLTGLGDALRELGCVNSDLTLGTLFVNVPPSEAYEVIKAAVAGLAYTEDVNVMYFDALTVRFSAREAGTELTFSGSNATIYERIRAAFAR
jgi:hypothetical protein